MLSTLTVIVPNYNNEKYIKTCIESIFFQDYPVNEVIVYDDASTDSSVEILNELENEYSILKVVYATENRGVSYARDYAIRSANSEYICMIDGDDFYYSQSKLSAEMKAINDNSGKMSCSFSQTVDVDENGGLLGVLSHKSLKNIRFNTVTRLYGKFCPRDFVFPKKAYIEVGGYRQDMKLFEDWELTLRLMSICEFKFSNEFGTAYRHKTAGLSKTSAKKQYDAKKNAFKINEGVLKYTVTEKIVFYILLKVNYLRALFKN